MLFGSAFSANLAAISCLIKGQNKDSLVNSDTLVISDELNHRSIVEGIRVANLPDTQKIIFPHFNLSKLDEILSENAGKYSRVLIITDGVFSMLGEFQNLKIMREITDKHNNKYSQGVLLIVDDCHGIGVLGKSGRGVEETSGVKSDVLVGTLGKAFGADGGYVTGDRILIDYLRESAATYIYSNPVSPGTAGAALAAVRLIRSPAGKKIIAGLQKNIYEFKRLLSGSGVIFAVDSSHAIQPLLLGDTAKAKALESYLFRHGILTTSITYPVVPKGRDEIRVQLSAAHTREDLKYFAKIVNNFYN